MTSITWRKSATKDVRPFFGTATLESSVDLAEIRLYERLFAVPAPGARREGDAADVERNFLDDINPDSKRLITAQLEPALKDAQPEQRFQFERHGYFVADRVDSRPGAPVFNRALTLKDSSHKGA